MTFSEFQILHSKVIGCFQLIENDLKWIYALMRKGDVDENFDSLDKTNLGFVIKILKKLDNSDGKPFLSPDDYNFLNQMRKKRNYWCHQCYVDFMYLPDGERSRGFNKICLELQRDYQRVIAVQNNVEQAKIVAGDMYSRD